MTDTTEFYAVATVDNGDPIPFDQETSFFTSIDAAVRCADFETLNADEKEPKPRVYRVVELPESAHWHWGVATEAASSGVMEYVNERAARSDARDRPVMRRRAGTDAWEAAA